MLKKILPNIAYVFLMFVLGFVIYYFFLSPNNLLNHSSHAEQKLSTEAFFNAHLTNENGVKQAVSQYKGKTIVLNFWATWCPPCREEMPELSKVYNAYQAKNVVVLGVAIDELAQVKMFTQETPVSYPLLVSEEDGMNIANSLGNDKGVLPYTIIINADGHVVKTYFGRITKSLLETSLNPLMSH